MVLFDDRALLNFPLYGISIPSLDSRKTRTLQSLRDNPLLKKNTESWLVDGFEDTVSLDDLVRVNCPDYAASFFDDRVGDVLRTSYELVNPDGSYNRWDPRVSQFPLTDMVPHIMKMAAGAYRASRYALDKGFCQYLGGGTHHGHWDFGHGFCPVNDAAVAIRRLQAEGFVQRVWVIDVDAHKGDGTASIFSQDETVFTLSIHMARGWPLDGSLPSGHSSWIPSDLDIPVESGEEAGYLERLDTGLRSMRERQPADLAIVLAGSDPWEEDALPSSRPLRLRFDQITERDRMVYGFLEESGVPSAWLTSGGYGEKTWRVHEEFLSWVLNERIKKGLI